MKICQITDLYPPYVIGGAEILVEAISNKLLEKGHEVTIITSAYEKEVIETIDGLKIYRVKPMNLYPLYKFQEQSAVIRPIWHLFDLVNLISYKKIKSILIKENPDIVHIHNFKGLSPLIFKAVKDLKLPLVFTAHDYSLICLKTSLLKKNGEICEEGNSLCKSYNLIKKMIIADKPDVIISPSKFLIEKLKSHGLPNNIKTIVLPNAVKLNHSKINKNYDKVEFLYVGSLESHKGPQILIKAFKEIYNDDTKLHIVGKGSAEAELKKNASDDKRIKFHGFLKGNDLMDLYKQANLMVIPSIWYDNSPMVIYESFMNSTPVIGSEIGGIPELVQDGYNGFLFKAGDFEELKEIMEYVIKNKTFLRRLEKNAYDSSHEYDIEDHISKLETIYRELL